MANDSGGTRRPSPAFADRYRRGVTNAALLCPGSTYGQTRRTGATPSSAASLTGYQGGFIELPGMQRRATEIASRRKELQHKRTNVADERTAARPDNKRARPDPARHRHQRGPITMRSTLVWGSGAKPRSARSQDAQET
jgi:hypothetical protein